MEVTTVPLEHTQAGRPHPVKVGMVCFLITEVAFFSTLIVAYITYLGHYSPGDLLTPKLLEPGLAAVGLACLLASSGTFYFAESALRRGGRGGFQLWLVLTLVLGVTFLVLTGWEWSRLLQHKPYPLTIRQNLFGSTYFTLLGFHGFHVSLGLLSMLIMLGLSGAGRVSETNGLPVEMIGWYWHFVDGVYIVIFTLVYVVSRTT